MPLTVDDAVDLLIEQIPLRDRAYIAAMGEHELLSIQFHLGLRIRNDFGLWSDNQELLESCRKASGEEELHPDDAAVVIVKALWKKLRPVEGREMKGPRAVTFLFLLTPVVCFAWEGRVTKIIDGDTIDVDVRYERTVWIVSFGDLNINRLLVESGYAWVYNSNPNTGARPIAIHFPSMAIFLRCKLPCGSRIILVCREFPPIS